MLLRGLWHLCDDGVVRPVIRGEVEAGDGSWVQVPFLVDTAADRTVFSADILAALHLQRLRAAYGHQKRALRSRGGRGFSWWFLAPAQSTHCQPEYWSNEENQ